MSDMSRPASRKSKVSSAGYMIGIVVFLVLISPTINSLVNERDWLRDAFYFLILATAVLAVLLIEQRNYLPVIIAASMLLAISYSQGPVKGVGFALTFYLAYIGATRYRVAFFYSILCAAILNYFFMLGQLSGHFEVLYSFVNYANAADPVPFLSVDSVPVNYLPQIRPSGLFPTTTYISVFCILLFSVALFEKESLIKYVLAFIGSFFMVTGATIGLFLAVIFAALLLPRARIAAWLVLGYLFTIIVYFVIVPELAQYNFSIADFRASVMNRVMDESILIINPELLLFIMLIFGVLVFIGLFKIKEYAYLVAPLSLVFLPILLHDIISSLMYSIMLGAAAGMLSGLLKWPRIVLRPVDHI